MAIKTRLIAAGATAVLALAGTITYNFEGEKHTVYKDIVNINTVCVGHTGSELKPGMVYGEKKCTELFLKDLIIAEKAVNVATPNLPQASKPAIISFVFNVGGDAYAKSTAAKKFNSGDIRGGCRELLRWVYAGGEVVPGLLNRRKVEYSECMKGA